MTSALPARESCGHAFRHRLRAVPLALALALALGLAGGCESVPGERVPVDSRITIHDPLPRPSDEDLGTVDAVPVYRVGRKDRVEVLVRDHPEFGGLFEIDRHGKLEIPLIERDLTVDGLSIAQVEQLIASAVKPFLRGNPEVRLTVKEARSKFFYAFGAIGAPGRHPIGEDVIDLRDAIIQAGLLRPEAATNRVLVITPDPENPTHVVVNARTVLLGLTHENLRIRNGDILYVPTSTYSKINRILDEFLGEVGRGINVDATYQYLESRFRSGGARLVDPLGR